MVAGDPLKETSWLVYKDSKQYGPFSLRELVEIARSGRIAPSDLVWCSEWSDWRPAGAIPELFTPPPPPKVQMPLSSGDRQAPATASHFTQDVEPKARFGNVAGAFVVFGAVLSVCDFLQRVGPFTTIVLVASLIALAVAYLLKQRGKLRHDEWAKVTLALGFMLAGSVGLKAMQLVIPDANANGVIAQLVPGAGALQDAMLSSLGRIEEQTKRVGELLEESAKREQAERDARDEVTRTEIETLRNRIREGGYSLDEAGYMAAGADRYRYVGDFSKVGIKLTEEGLRKFLATLEDDDKLANFAIFLFNRRDGESAARAIASAVGADGKKMGAAFRTEGAQDLVCKPAEYGTPIAPLMLAEACRLEGAAFATAYAQYFNATYSRIMYHTMVDRNAALSDKDYLADSVGAASTTQIAGPLVLSKLPACGRYQGELSFSIDYIQPPSRSGGLLPDEYLGGSSPGGTFWLYDAEAIKAGIKHICGGGWSGDASPICRGQVIVSRSCDENPDIRVTKVLSLEEPTKMTFGAGGR